MGAGSEVRGQHKNTGRYFSIISHLFSVPSVSVGRVADNWFVVDWGMVGVMMVVVVVLNLVMVDVHLLLDVDWDLLDLVDVFGVVVLWDVDHVVYAVKRWS